MNSPDRNNDDGFDTDTEREERDLIINERQKAKMAIHHSCQALPSPATRNVSTKQLNLLGLNNSMNQSMQESLMSAKNSKKLVTTTKFSNKLVIKNQVKIVKQVVLKKWTTHNQL